MIARVRQALKKLPWKKIGVIGLIVTVVAMIIFQFAYGSGRAMLGSQVDGINVGGLADEEASVKIKDRYQKRELAIYFGKANQPYRSPQLKDLGLSIKTESAVSSTHSPWWLSLVPTSLWWGHLVISPSEPDAALKSEAVESYTSKELGESCKVKPKNASLTVRDDHLKLVPSEAGGRCELDDVVTAVSSVVLAGKPKPDVRIALESIKPAVSDTAAMKLLDTLEASLAKDIALNYGDKRYPLKPNQVRKWLVFSADKKQLKAAISLKKAEPTLNKLLANEVARAPGTLTIKTRDFQEVSRSGGGSGQALNTQGTATSLADYLVGGNDKAMVAVSKVLPHRKYIRSYSSTDVGLSALMKNYASDHSGAFGISLIELSGKRRRAEYQADKNFFPASAYKVYVAYSTLRQVESGKLKWSTNISGGRDLKACFDDMLVLSDNPCAEELTLKIGVTQINSDLADLGLTNTKFVGPMKHRSTAADMSTFMASLESGQLPISSANRGKFIGALKRNVYRQGIPAGARGTVANKVGFIDRLLHDTAIVYAPSGTYVLTIMSDKSSWSSIASLTEQIQKLLAK